MNARAPRNGIVVITAAFCCAWLGAVVYARHVVELATDARHQPWNAGQACGIAAALVCSCALLASWPKLGGGHHRDLGTGVTTLLFAAASGAMVANHGVAYFDAAATLVTLLGMTLVLSNALLSGAATLAFACGCSPLAAPAVMIFGAIPYARTVQIGLGLLVVLGGAFINLLLDASGLRPFPYVLAPAGPVAEVGAHQVWRIVAWWTDLVMPAVALAMLAVADWLALARAPSDAAPANEWTPRFTRAASAWWAMTVLVALVMPRVVPAHGLLFALPAFLLAAVGWRLLRHLPFSRDNWTLSTFSAACCAFLIVLLWPPLRQARDVIVVALFGK